MASKRLNQLEKDLIKSIMKPRRTFDMSRWKKHEDAPGPATCGTACCLAGHIAAIRPKLAKKFAPDATYGAPDERLIDHAHLAAMIYHHETGKACNLDFYGARSFKSLDDITREDAVGHIRGQNPDWPLIP